MKIFPTIAQRLRHDYIKWRYRRAARRVLFTRPLNKGKLPFMLLSMVHTRDVVSYLVAAKSFAQYASPERIVVVCDPSISQSDRVTFKRHIPHIELRDATEFLDPLIPEGGTWERLHAIATYAPDNYIVQLDADTVTINPIHEVVHAISNGEAFVLGGEPGEEILTLNETSLKAKRFVGPNMHIQDLTEWKLGELDAPPQQMYVRGCSGFTGFPRNPNMRAKLLAFSAQMQALVGERWKTWGTEQVTSNYLVANAHGVKILPYAKYTTPNFSTGETAFLHFIGYTRFVNTQYERASQKVIQTLRSTLA